MLPPLTIKKEIVNLQGYCRIVDYQNVTKGNRRNIEKNKLNT